MSEWIGWNGGECPVHDNTIVEVQYSIRAVGEAHKFGWMWESPSYMNIIAYRVIKEHKEPREFWAVGGSLFDSCNSAGRYKLQHCNEGAEIIHVREVLDENS